jgi:hypothetical protein
MVLEVGVPGAAGSAGAAATITVGTTTTISAGSPATVNNSGTSSAAVFNFGIPQGTAGTNGVGVPVGGSTGQLLSKQSGASYDTTWTTVIPGDRYLTTSTTSNTISNTNKTFTIGTGLSYTPTQNITISFDAAHHMHGEVLTYDSGTGVLTVDIKNHTGSGTYASWVVNVGGVTPATSVAWGGITGTLSSQTDLQTALDDKLALAGGTMDAAATIVLSTATNNSLVSGDVFGIELTADPTQNASLAFSGLTVQDGAGTTQITPAGISFPDFTTQSTAAVSGIPDAPSDGSNYGRLDAGWSVVAPLSSPAFSNSISITDLDGTVTINGAGLNLSGSAQGFVVLGTSGITFADASVQTTAAITPPSADVLTANAIASNISSMGYGSSAWLGNSSPSIAGLIGWGIYNATDGLIAYSYSTGNTFYLASSPTTLANSSVQVNGSNSSFYVA